MTGNAKLGIFIEVRGGLCEEAGKIPTKFLYSLVLNFKRRQPPLEKIPGNVVPSWERC